MSNFFEDKVMSELESSDEGWLTLAIEPYTYSLSERLEESDLPSTYELTYDDVIECMGNWMRLSPENIMKMLLTRHKVDNITYEELEPLLAMKDGGLKVEGNLILDLENKTLTGSITFSIPELDEANLKSFIIGVTQRKFMHYPMSRKHNDLSTLNDIMSLLECEHHRKSKSISKKQAAISSRYIAIISDNEWKIKSCDLILKATDWLFSAMEGNIHAKTNLTKLKCMTHSGKVIYSMEEID